MIWIEKIIRYFGYKLECRGTHVYASFRIPNDLDIADYGTCWMQMSTEIHKVCWEDGINNLYIQSSENINKPKWLKFKQEKN